jgi:hypothetical protein
MPIDTSIYGQIRPLRLRDPLETAGNALAVQNAQQANQLNALKFSEMQRAQADSLADEEAMRAYYQSGGQNLNALNARPRLRAAEEKRQLDAEKERAEIRGKSAVADKTQLDVALKRAEREANMLRSANDQRTWTMLRDVIGREAGPDALSRIPAEFNPQYRDAMLSATLDEAKRIDQQLQARGQDLSAQTQRRGQDISAATQRRGQDMADVRENERIAISREGLDRKAASKPIPPSALKVQQEDLEALQTFRGLDADLRSIEKQIGSGALNLGPVDNLLSAGRNRIGLSNEQSRNYESFKAKLENMRNAVLLLNKGVQTEGDAQRAMNELMSNLNDPGVVQQRLAEIRKINQRAADIRKNNVNILRQNFGAEPLDFAPLENQPSAIGAPSGLPSMDAIEAEIRRRQGR